MHEKGTIGGIDPGLDDENGEEVFVLEDELPMQMPAQMLGSPAWAQFIWAEMRHDRKNSRARDMYLGRRLFKVEKLVAHMDGKLGEESPNGDGGTGFIGELRRVGEDVESLKNERNFIRGAIAAITAAGAFLVYGLQAWIKNLAGPHK